MAIAAKRRKIKAIIYPCHTCLEDRTTGQFPDYNPTESCDHLINTCKRCLKQWIESQIETTVFTPHIQCPQCNENMDSSDVEVAVPKKMFARYVELERRYIAENTPGWRWCLAPGCQSGQVHKSGAGDESPLGSRENTIELSEAKGSSWTGWIRRSVRTAIETQKLTEPATTPSLVFRPRAPNICTCKDCGAKACVPCDRPWHENETCSEYLFRIKDRIEEEDKSLAAIQKQTKKCPSCSKSIEKDGGCRHMQCTQCRTEFCWECGQMINRNGQYCGCDNPIPGH